jgi:exodeoxyribonuclease VIII
MGSDYHKIDAVSNSMLSLLKRSPWTFYRTYVTTDPAEKMEPEETDAMRLGSAVHTLALEPEKFGAEYLVLDGPINPRTEKPYGRESDKFKAWLEAEKNQNGNGRTILIREEFAEGLAIAQSFQSHPEIAAIMASRAEKFFELESFGHAAVGGFKIPLKCKLDFVCPELKLIVDLKSTQDPSEYEWAWSAGKFGYYRQAAMYIDMMELLYGERFDFLFGAVRSKPPYDSHVYRLGSKSINKGQEEYMRLIEQYAERKQTGDWKVRSQRVATEIEVKTRGE